MHNIQVLFYYHYDLGELIFSNRIIRHLLPLTRRFIFDVARIPNIQIDPAYVMEQSADRDHFLGIGIRKSPTARLVFTSKTGPGCTATVVDLGNRFRLIVNDVECIEPKPLPKLPVASALWIPMPDFEVGAGAWILAGGTHHSCFSYDLTAEYWEDYAEIAGIEMIHINKNTTISEFKKELRMNEVYYMLNKALV